MREIGFAEMNAFAEVAGRRSFARAAANLGVSRSALSETIRAVEERLGVRLLNRTTRSVAPTEAGERLLARLRPVLDDFAAALDAVNAFRDTPSGTLRLTVPPPAARGLIEPLLAKFMAAHPAIAVEISVDGILRDIVRERFDAGIRIGERIDRDMVALRVQTALRFVVLAAPAYLARRGTPRTPDDLHAHDCLRIRFPSGALQPWTFRKAGKSVEVAVGGTLIANEAETLVRAAADGAGVAYLLADYAARPLADGRLVPLLEDWTPPFAGFYLYYPTRRQLPAPLRAFVEFLRAEGLIAKSPLAPAKRSNPPRPPRRP